MTALLRHSDVTAVSEKLQKSLSISDDDAMETYNRLVQDGKDYARAGNLAGALTAFKAALELRPSHKLESRITKIQEIIAQDDSEEEDEFVNVNNSGLMIFRELHDKLYDYQKEGVAFLYGLHRDGLKGGILADDMGLGKTIQVISFLSGMYDSELVKHTLLIMPTSLITNWTKEFSIWVPGMRVKEFHGTSRAERTRNLEKVQRRGGVIITTYTMLMNNWQQLASYQGREFTWDYMILDEAHKIKTTSTKTAKSATAVPSKNRLLLTGTPVQNNLREMWALFDFACQGTLLGTAKTFKAEYENPITRAREKDATPGEKALGFRMSENLMAIIKPHFFRRTKAEVQKKKTCLTPSKTEKHLVENGSTPNHRTDTGAVMPKLTRKNDLIIWTYLSAIQEEIYRQFISLDHIKELLLTTRSPLAELTILKKVCDHPRLLSAGAFAKLGLQEPQEGDDSVPDAQSIAGVPDSTLIAESGKMVFLFALLEQLRLEGHRTLVFARFRKVLDIIERILDHRGFRVLRLDGSITQISERERRISLFQNDKRYSVFLLTTQVGGVGITLTAANRVVIFDPSWNPATDAQAVDRAYRIGQTENVVIYRLITCGTVEEKIYRRQVFKDSLIRQNTGDKKNPFRYFSKQELRELFTLEDPRSSSTQLQLQELHAQHRRTDASLDCHIAQLHSMNMFGISDHDLMFSLDPNQEEEPEDQHYIEGRVHKAQELMKAESELHMQLVESVSSRTEAAWLRMHSDKLAKDPPQPKSSSKAIQSPSSPQDHREVTSLDSGSGRDGSHDVIDLTKDQSTAEESANHLQEENGCSNSPDASIQDRSQPVLFLSESLGEAGGDTPPQLSNVSLHFGPTAGQEVTNSPIVQKDCQTQHALDGCQSLSMNASSFQANTSSCSVDGQSWNNSFNLQLEDSEASLQHQDQDHDQETEAQQEKLLSILQMQGSFDVDKSLSQHFHQQTLVRNTNAAEMSNNSPILVARKKKKAAVIYDSEEDDDQQHLKNNHEVSFQVLEASTPKSAMPNTARRQKSIAGNTSVASRRSVLLLSITDALQNPEEEGLEQELGDRENSNGEEQDAEAKLEEEGLNGDKKEREEQDDTEGEEVDDTEGEELEDTEEELDDTDWKPEGWEELDEEKGVLEDTEEDMEGEKLGKKKKKLEQEREGLEDTEEETMNERDRLEDTEEDTKERAEREDKEEEEREELESWEELEVDSSSCFEETNGSSN